MKRDIEGFTGIPAAAENGNVSWLVSDVRAVPAEAIKALRVVGSKVANLVLKTGYEWQVITASDGTCFYTVALENTENGTLYNNSLLMKTTKLLPTPLLWLQRYAQVPMVFLVKEINGFTRLIGLPTEPMTLTGNGGSADFMWQYDGMTTVPGYVVMANVGEVYEFSKEFSKEFNS